MLRLYSILALILFLSLLDRSSGFFPKSIRFAFADPKEPSSRPLRGQGWREKMQDLYRLLAEVTTDMSSTQRFSAPENRTRVAKHIKQLSERAHDLSLKEVPPDLDPSIKIVSDLFQDETKRAYSAYRAGNYAYSRSVLGQVSGYCIACHTRNGSGPQFTKLPLEPTAKNLPTIEMARFYVATRQYDRALELYEKIAQDSTAAENRPVEWEQAIREGLALSVRVKKSPDQAIAMITPAITLQTSPPFLKQDALKWRESLEQWKKETPRPDSNEENLHSEAVRLMTQARELQKYPMDHAGDVLYLRALPVIHQLLQIAPNGKYAQEGLLLAGVSYDVMRTLSLDSFQDLYYKACINKNPHSTMAETCYRRYEQSVYQGYTGSAGTDLPDEIKKDLQEMKRLAFPLTPAKPN